MNDEALMGEALALSRTARRVAPPNPWVGALVVRDGVELARAATAAPGGAHAEVAALAIAGERARGATLVTTLEPCAHQGRTGPCAEAIVSAGVTTVLVGVEDPDANVRGAGIARLRAAGIDVRTGLCEQEVSDELAPYLWHRRTGRPFVVAKVASTLDGRVAMADGSSQWITSPEARADGHQLRADSQAIIIGAGTVRSDDPELTARLDEGVVEPLRVVLGAAPPGARVRPCLERTGELSAVLDELGGLGVLQALVEGGPTTLRGFIECGLVNKLVWYLAPALAGASGGRGAIEGLSTKTIAALRRGSVRDVRRIGEDVRVEVDL
jgi:diaminohydroxyphosphoribosylaminopyrimidine deaminase/5-amino-6-(5-phosphoribosylamino)uracil reductase